MGTWRYTTRVINGKRTKVKVMTVPSSGRTLVRKVGSTNYSDKGAKYAPKGGKRRLPRK